MKEVGFTSHTGVLLSQINRYHITNVGTFLKPMLIIEHVKMIQMLYLDIRSMLLSGQVPYRTNSSQLFWNGLFQKKKQGGLRTFFCYSLYSWKFQAKQSSTSGNLLQLCMLHPSEISRPKNQDPWKFYMNFSWSSLEIPLCF